jgi:hypothetical protein
VKISAGNQDIAFGANEVFIPQEMIATGITKPWKKKAYEIIPEIV